MPFISPPSYEEIVIGSSTIPFLYDYVGWAPAIDNHLHPALCSGCSNITSDIWDHEFALKGIPKYDCCQSLEGFYLFSSRAQKALTDSDSGLRWKPIANSDTYVLIPSSVAIIQVDEESSELRNSGVCDTCSKHIETLYGLDLSASIPTAVPLVRLGSIEGVQMTSCFLGAGFRRTQILHFEPELLDTLVDMRLTGFDKLKMG